MIDSFYHFFGSSFYSAADADTLQKLDECKSMLGKNVLDICCGSGRYAHALAKQGISVMGIDIHESFIAEAKKDATALEVFMCKNVKENKMEKIFSSIILLGNSLAHFSLQEFDNIIKKYKKNLQKKGVFFIDVSLPTALLTQKEFHWRNIKEEVLAVSFTEGKIQRKFQREHESVVLDSYIWFPYQIDFLMQKNGFSVLQRFSFKNTVLILYKNE